MSISDYSILLIPHQLAVGAADFQKMRSLSFSSSSFSLFHFSERGDLEANKCIAEIVILSYILLYRISCFLIWSISIMFFIHVFQNVNFDARGLEFK